MFAIKPRSRIFSAAVVFATILMLAFSTLGVTSAYAAGVLYVKPSGVGNCTSWAAACNLQTALTNATSGQEIWAAAGTYKPGATRAATFKLKNSVAVYGGFAGTETTRDQRNPTTHPTILSGDVDNNDSQTPIITNINTVTGNSTNSYHVVTGAANATLDGFTITAGSAPSSSLKGGGGMYTNVAVTLVNIIFRGNLAEYGGGGMESINGSPKLTNVSFINNKASSGGGGGMHVESGSPILTNVTFSNNLSDRGGGLQNSYSSITLTNVTFSNNSTSSQGLGGGMDVYGSMNIKLTNVTFDNNSADEGGGLFMGISSTGTITNATFNNNSANKGGGIYCTTFDLTLKNVTIHNNSASNSGGGIYNDCSDLYIRNTILWGNTSVHGPQIQYGATSINDSVIQNGCPAGSTCANIITTNPLLGTLGNYGGFTQTILLQAGSSAIDTGNDSTCPATDQRNMARPQGAHCDIGAFEYVEPVTETLTVKSVAAQDGWVLESSETSMVGGTFNGSNPTLVLGDDVANKQYRGVLSFNTASLPDSAVVTGVTLKVKQSAIVGGGDPVADFQGFVADVKTGFFGTAAGLQAADFQAAPSKAIGPLSLTPSSNWYTINLANAKTFINKLSTNDGVTQIRLRFKLDDNNDAVANYLSLFSGNATNAADRPQLVILYYIP